MLTDIVFDFVRGLVCVYLFGVTPQDNFQARGLRLRALGAWRSWVHRCGWFWLYDHVGSRGTLLAMMLGEDPRDREWERPGFQAAIDAEIARKMGPEAPPPE